MTEINPVTSLTREGDVAVVFLTRMGGVDERVRGVPPVGADDRRVPGHRDRAAEAVARRVNLPTTEAAQLLPHGGVVALEQVAPGGAVPAPCVRSCRSGAFPSG